MGIVYSTQDLHGNSFLGKASCPKTVALRCALESLGLKLLWCPDGEGHSRSCGREDEGKSGMIPFSFFLGVLISMVLLVESSYTSTNLF